MTMTKEKAVEELEAKFAAYLNERFGADASKILSMHRAIVREKCGEQKPQSQDALKVQLIELQRLANLNGLYDAADWLRERMRVKL
jgi:hypothetical protein